ncbi:MAG: arsenate reductase-like protein [Firmicutes bacterium]|nr:arsenate reductase-like protein [Bacillota bacterium]
MKFICYPKCSTCKKAQKWLDANDISYEVRNIQAERPDEKELALWQRQSGLPLRRFFNTSGLLYRSMDLARKLDCMAEDEQLRLLSTDGLLVKRPLFVGSDFVLVGFKETEWAEKLLKY